MPELMLELEDVSVAYDGVPAVQEVSVTVGAGRRLALLGPSGCGKTSLLRAVAGLEPLASGAVRIAGQDMARVPTYRRGVGMMFQGHALFPHLDAAGNVAFGLRMAHWPRKRIQDRVEQMLTLVGLTDRGDARITALSGGEQQRVALARTLAPGPGLALLDEPLSSLDRALREDLLEEMVKAFAVTGTTAVLVTHDQSEALRFGHDVAVMHAGRIVRFGAPEEVWADPQQAWTARFLGLANVVGPDHPAAAAGESAGAYLIRPDLLRLVDGGEGLPGHVTAKAFRGGLSVLTVQLAAGEALDVWTVGGDERVGDAVLVLVPPRAVRPLLA
jgi:thiamine transport system ATP-binding protein